jgi:hypothetical protein
MSLKVKTCRSAVRAGLTDFGGKAISRLSKRMHRQRKRGRLDLAAL